MTFPSSTSTKHTLFPPQVAAKEVVFFLSVTSGSKAHCQTYLKETQTFKGKTNLSAVTIKKITKKRRKICRVFPSACKTPTRCFPVLCIDKR